MEISTYRMTIIAAVVVLILSVGIVTVLGGPANTTAYLGLVGGVAIPGLFALFRLEKNAQESAIRHEENKQTLSDNKQALDQLVNDNISVKSALLSLRDPSVSVDQAAHAAANAIQPERDPTLGGTH